MSVIKEYAGLGPFDDWGTTKPSVRTKKHASGARALSIPFKFSTHNCKTQNKISQPEQCD